MATRKAFNLRTAREEEIDIVQERCEEFTFWPPSYLNFWYHIRRIAPDAPTYLLPRQAGDPFGRHEGDEGGRITVFGSARVYEQSTLFHELWHHAEGRLLSERDCEIVYAEVRRGDDWCHDYLDSATERAARAFEHYASARAHGLNLAAARRESAQAVFERIYEGIAHADYEKKRRRERFSRPIQRLAAPVGLGGFMVFMFVVLPHLLAP